MVMLATAVHGLTDLDALAPKLMALGARHAGYGVKDSHYKAVGEALIWTLERGLADAFTPEVEQQFYGGLRSEEVAVVKAKLDYIVTLTESASSPSATSEIDALIDEARIHITPRDAQIAVMLLNRLQRTRGGDLSDWHWFRIFTNLGASSLMLGKGEAQ